MPIAIDVAFASGYINRLTTYVKPIVQGLTPKTTRKTKKHSFELTKTLPRAMASRIVSNFLAYCFPIGAPGFPLLRMPTMPPTKELPREDVGDFYVHFVQADGNVDAEMTSSTKLFRSSKAVVTVVHFYDGG